jgi:serine/threonine protein kinase
MPVRERLDFSPGDRFGERYRIIERIGRGGMGVVYKALDLELDRLVALKMIRPDLVRDPGMLERFKQELLLAGEVTHENVIRIHDLGDTDGIKYISMRFIEGSNLKELIQTAGRLSAERVISLAVQICEGLQAAHRQGVIHRDLKPHNIMVDRGGQVHVMDFGIARSVRSEDTPTRKTVIGTPEYLSPEQASGGPTDARSDIYSLGCVIYEMATGESPFAGSAPEEVLTKHLEEKPRPPSEIDPAIPASLERAIMKCLAKDRAARYESAAVLAGALREAAGDLGTQTIAPPAPPAETPLKSIAVLPFRDMSPEQDQEYFCGGMAEEIISAMVKVENLRVAALTSAFQFKGRNLDVREIGRRLDVDTVLEGSVRKAGDRLRVTVQLVKVADGYHVWSDRYERKMEDVFQIQDEISQAVASSLRLKFRPEEVTRKKEQRPSDMEAYNLYLRGRYNWNKRTKEGIRKGIEYFTRAIEKDPAFSPPYAGLADSYCMLQQGDLEENAGRAREAAMKALELDPDLGEAYTSLGWISMA